MIHSLVRSLLSALILAGLCSCSAALYPDPKQIVISEGLTDLGSDAKEKALGYRLGGQAALKGRWFDQEVQRRVFLARYAIDQRLVTQEEYEQFVRDTRHRAPFITKGEYQRQGFLAHSYEEAQGYLWHEGRPPSPLRNHPVVLVSVDDAETYCEWKGKRYGKRYRLPTEDEWEKAARGTDQRYFPWGNQWDAGKLNSVQNGPYHTTPVHRYPEGVSPYGLYDMAGNVFQWTSTSGTSSNNHAVLKGCSWDDHAGICRSASRHQRLKNSRHILIGFRCVQPEK